MIYNNNGIEFGFQEGRFDNFQVYNEENGVNYAPLDVDYMRSLLQLRNINNNIYNDFVRVYDMTNKNVNNDVFTLIEELSLNYGQSQNTFIKTMVNIYLTMIAEENKKGTKLGKKIKRLAIHKILNENVDVNTATQGLRGMPWRNINAQCAARGF